MGLGDDTAMSDGAPAALQVFKDEFKRITVSSKCLNDSGYLCIA